MSRRRYSPQSRDRRGPQKISKKYEETAVVLEIITPDRNRRKDKYRESTIVQAMGEFWFTLLEIIPNDENEISLLDEITLSKDERNNVQTIIGRLRFEDLTPLAEIQLPLAIDKIIEKQEKRFLTFINKASPISLRLHSLHLLKGIGPKSLKSILDERKIIPFSSYEEFEDRTKVKDIRALLTERIKEEIESDDIKHRLFTRDKPREFS